MKHFPDVRSDYGTVRSSRALSKDREAAADRLLSRIGVLQRMVEHLATTDYYWDHQAKTVRKACTWDNTDYIDAVIEQAAWVATHEGEEE